jgi:hypothetical protein
MAWLKLSGSTDPFTLRFPIAVHNSSSTANKDVQVVIPPELEAFWEAIDSSGFQIRVTSADGVTALQYDWASSPAFNKTSRVGTLEIYGGSGTPTWSAVGSAVSVLWVYVGDSDAGDGSSSVTISTPLTGYVTAAAPRAVIVAGSPPPGRATPPDRRSQRTTDKRGIWFGLDRNVLRTLRQPYNNHPQWEEVTRVTVTASTNGTGTLTPDLDAVRFVEDNGFYVQSVVSGGADANDYTLLTQITTVAPNDDADEQIASGVCLVLVRDADDD